MTRNVLTVDSDARTEHVAAMLMRNKISAVPVVDESGAVLGLVSEHDLLAKSGPTAADLMTRAIISVTTEADIDDVRHLLIEQRIRRVPVIDAGRLVGILSRADLVAQLVTEWVCQVCGEPVRGEQPPETCPKCGSPADRFTMQEQPPGS